ncbi:MIF4G domain-containing protein-like [Limulus polyphemus]|uniref:MIF4G domain-containing protein-like n=1 Tax=Limulus polyphemus TaxID=6850 RepID=A0ABM1BH03_LIMPO|nr:MIF4G domain-containing protein-like [Limulus polyphemus]
MGEDDSKTSSSLNMNQHFLHKFQHSQSVRQQNKEDGTRRQDGGKQTRKVAFPSKFKPSMEIYRPPGVRVAGDMTSFMKQIPASVTNGHYIQNDIINTTNMAPLSESLSQKTNIGSPKVHFQCSPTKFSGHRSSTLKRSKSFGGAEVMEMAAAGFDRDGYPIEYQGLVKKALQDPNSLSSRQLMEVVRVLCNKAVQSIQHAEPAAQMCFTIIEKDNSETFLESLLNSCREWYNERDKLLRSPLTSCHGGLDGTGGTFRRWTAYIFFLTELFLRFKSRHRNVIMTMSAQGGALSNSPTPTPAVEDRSLSLMMLIYECCEIILKPPSLNCVAEIECLRSVLTSVGRQLQLDSPQRMRQLVSLMRDAFINPSISSQIRKTLLELVELHASQWQLDLPQSMYYFPYTSMERK